MLIYAPEAGVKNNNAHFSIALKVSTTLFNEITLQFSRKRARRRRFRDDDYVFEEYPAVIERRHYEQNTVQQAAFGAPKPMAARNGSNAAQAMEMSERSRHAANNAAMVHSHARERSLNEYAYELQGSLAEGADNGVVESF